MSNTLTDLEAIVLGVIQRAGPCTAYQVHQAFHKSPSLFFSGSAGAIYPLVKRLEGRGLVSGTTGGTGRRQHRILAVTRSGQDALNAWMHAHELAADAGFDPLRARLSVWDPDKEDDAGKACLMGFLQALDNRLDRVRATESVGPIDGLPLDRAREMEIATLEAKTGLIRKWIRDLG